MYIYIYIYIYICTYIYIYITHIWQCMEFGDGGIAPFLTVLHTYIHTHLSIFIYIYVCTYSRAYIYMYNINSHLAVHGVWR